MLIKTEKKKWLASRSPHFGRVRHMGNTLMNNFVIKKYYPEHSVERRVWDKQSI